MRFYIIDNTDIFDLIYWAGMVFILWQGVLPYVSTAIYFSTKQSRFSNTMIYRSQDTGKRNP